MGRPLHLRQSIDVETLAGRRKVLIPVGWEFAKTDIFVWRRLLALTAERSAIDLKRRGAKTKAAVLDAQISLCGQILADSLGMAATYWVMDARAQLVEHPETS